MEELNERDLFNIRDMFGLVYNTFGYDDFSESKKETLKKVLLLHFLAEFEGDEFEGDEFEGDE